MQKQIPRKESEQNDLRLFGSQINLCERPPRVNSRNGSVRSSSVCSRRSMSAVPAFCSQVSLSERLWRRPLSADSPYTPGEFMWASHCNIDDHQTELLARTATSSATIANEANVEEDTGCELGFGNTYTLPSVLLLEDLTTEDFGRTWTETPTARTEHSEDQCRSEKSLGQRIISMAQQTSQSQDAQAFALDKKPPLPFPKPVLNKGTYKKVSQNVTLSRDSGLSSFAPSSASSKQSRNCDKSDISKSTSNDCTGTDSQSLSSSSSMKSEKEMSKKLSFCSITSQSLEIKFEGAGDNILNEINTEVLAKDAVTTGETASSNIGGDDLYVNGMGGEKLSEDHDHLVDLKFQHWFRDTEKPQTAHSLSRRVWEAERRTDVLLEQLAAEDLLSSPHSNLAPDTVENIEVAGTVAGAAKCEQTTSETLHQSSPIEKVNEGEVFGVNICPDQDSMSRPRSSSVSANELWVTTHEVPEHDIGTSSCRDIVSSAASPAAGLAAQSKMFASETKLSDCMQAPCDVERSIASEEVLYSSTSNRGESIISISTTTVQDTEIKKLTLATTELANDSTYEDIVNVLKIMEQEETGTVMNLDKLTMSPPLDTFSSSISTENGCKKTSASGKLKDILSFLDEVDQCCDSEVNSAKNLLQTPRDTSQAISAKSSGVPRLDELLQLSVVDLAHQVLTLQLQLDERSSSLGVLQDALAEQRQNAHATEKELRARLRDQKKELEAVISRHQKFIDQLIADKKTLSDKCESLVAELRKAEERFGVTLRTMEERHAIELQRAKEMHAAAEKLRRERWIDNKTQKIKEMTVKGLEPELQRMTARHQQELADLRAIHKQELEEVEVRAVRRASSQLEQLAVERDQALAREKEQLRQRLEKQLSEEEERYQELRRRLMAEVQHEKERLSQEAERMQLELEDTRRNLVRDSERAIDRAKSEFREALDSANRRHQSDLQLAKEAVEAEKEAWMHAYKKQQAILLSEKETEIRNQLRRERDKEIELVIERLESEASQSRAELEQATDNRLRRLKEKHDAEVKDLEVSEAAVKNKYNSAKQRLIECEDQIISQQAQIRQLEKELQEARKITDRLCEERAAVKEVVQREVSGQVLALEQEVARMRDEAAEARVRAQLELAGKEQDISVIVATKEREMQQVYHRVKLAVAKKDEAFKQLKKQYEGALERCCHLEKMLEQQRRDFLLK